MSGPTVFANLHVLIFRDEMKRKKKKQKKNNKQKKKKKKKKHWREKEN